MMPKAPREAVIPPQSATRTSCPTCGHALVRADFGWVCPKGLDHSRIVTDDLVVAVIFKSLPKEKPEAMSPNQWGWYRTRRKAWAERVLREIRRRKPTPSRVGGGKNRRRRTS